VDQGRLRLVRHTVDDHLVVLHTAREGDLFAEAALFSDTYHCDAITVVTSRVRTYPKDALLAVLRRDPALFEAFAARLTHQLQALRARLELRNVRSARERLLHYLALVAGPDGRTVKVDGLLQDIAFDLGLTREAFYRTLATVESEGLIERRGDRILLRTRTVV
jgi:CRP-like cAMP-binding protein